MKKKTVQFFVVTIAVFISGYCNHTNGFAYNSIRANGCGEEMQTLFFNTPYELQKCKRDTALLMFERFSVGGTWGTGVNDGFTAHLCSIYDSLRVPYLLYPDTAMIVRYSPRYIVDSDTFKVMPEEIFREYRKLWSFCTDCPFLEYDDKKFEKVIQGAIDHLGRNYVFNGHRFNVLKCAYTYYVESVGSIQQINYGMKYGMDSVHVERRLPTKIVTDIKVLGCGLSENKYSSVN